MMHDVHALFLRNGHYRRLQNPATIQMGYFGGSVRSWGSLPGGALADRFSGWFRQVSRRRLIRPAPTQICVSDQSTARDLTEPAVERVLEMHEALV